MRRPSPLFLAEYGSRATGTAHEGSDHDLLGPYIPSREALYGLDDAPSGTFRIHRDGSITHVSSNAARAEGTDVEVKLYPLRKFASRAADGDLNTLSTLWATRDLLAHDRAEGIMLREGRELFLSRRAVRRSLEYARSQQVALTGAHRGRSTRAELVEKYGYDTKYAVHMIRALLTGLDLAREHTFHLPMRPEHIDILSEIRDGLWPLSDILTYADTLEHQLIDDMEQSRLPEAVDHDAINRLLIDVTETYLADPGGERFFPTPA